MKRILMLSYRFPYPLIDGSRIRIYNIGKILAEKYQVDLLSINEGDIANEDIEELEKIHNKVIPFSFNPIWFKINTLKGLFSKDSLQIYYHHFRTVQKWIDQHYKEYDLIFCVHIRMTKYLKNINNVPRVIDFVDATSLNYQEAQKNSTGIWKFIYPIENKRALSYEIKILKDYDKTFITSPFDRNYLLDNTEVPVSKLVLIPNGVREELLFRENKFKEENWIVFLGKMNYAPNVDAVMYFANEIFPPIIKEKSDIKFIIVGSSPSKEVLKLSKRKNIEVTGFVDDPYEYLEKAKIIVAPLRFSAGTQYKILEAMALEKVVITTSKGARGISGEDGKHFVVVDDEKEMAKIILDLMKDKIKRKKIGNSARELIKEKYSWNIIGKDLYKEIDNVLEKRL
ncbi:glycosyltransferase family 4 protein [Patescibacteria group bacterium]|nr:glycosyltransferase family 4 protein [Patescibacteria group bacterium]